jgi:hypothetical protein
MLVQPISLQLITPPHVNPAPVNPRQILKLNVTCLCVEPGVDVVVHVLVIPDVSPWKEKREYMFQHFF